MKKNNLLFRSLCSSCIIFIILFIVHLLIIFDVVPKEKMLVVSGFALVIICIGLVFICMFVINPHKKLALYMVHFLRGQVGEIDKDSKLAFTSKTEESMYTKLCELLHPSKLFELNKRQAQYLALQNQINPHFLYNTLESIRSEALMEGLHIVADMTEALSSFFRYTISNIENLVSVEDELENCETYFRIQQYRFGDRLSLDIHCDPEDYEKILKLRIPKLTLQPILENSIIHGTELQLQQGLLSITLEITEQRLLIQISDNGIGMNESTLVKLNSKIESSLETYVPQGAKGGLALPNVNNRIRLLFGEEYGIHVFSLEGSGTDVEISLPIVENDTDTKIKKS